jgi:GntR family transcriptional regulator
MEINPHSPVPKHQQLREILLELIATGLEPDMPIPSERELGQRHGLSRMTVRRTIDQLVADGRLHRVRARGTFVGAPAADVQLGLTSFTDDMGRRGMVPAARILAFERIEASPVLAQQLEIQPGDGVVRLARLRYADAVPMAYEQCLLPEHRVPGILGLGSPKSLYRVLSEEYGLTPSRGDQVIEANHPDLAVAALLEIPSTGAVLQVTRRCYSDDVLVDHSSSVYRADRYPLSMLLERRPDPG